MSVAAELAAIAQTIGVAMLAVDVAQVASDAIATQCETDARDILRAAQARLNTLARTLDVST